MTKLKNPNWYHNCTVYEIYKRKSHATYHVVSKIFLHISSHTISCSKRIPANPIYHLRTCGLGTPWHLHASGGQDTA